MSQHLPILQVVIPLLAAPLCLLLRQRLLARSFALVTVGATFAVAVAMLPKVLAEGTLLYAIGGWPAPLGIEYSIDTLAAYVLLVISGVAFVVLCFGSGVGSARIPEGRAYLFYAAYLLALAGLLGIVATNDLFNVFVFLEISSLASYTLIALGRQRRALMAAYSYLIAGTVGGVFFLLGVGLAYQMTGTLNIADLATRLPELLDSRTIRVSFAFLVVGTSIKLAVFPLHQWLPNAYAFAPSTVSAFLAATATKVSYYLLIRLIFVLFGATFVFETLRLDRLLLPLSLIAMFSGSIAAVYQRRLKRLLAYSSISQIGYLTLAITFASITGLTGGLVHLFNHALMKGALFLAVAAMVYRLGSSEISRLQGIGRSMPWTTAAFVTGGLALIGVPGTAGFVSKWYLVLAALEKGWYPVALAIVLSSLLAVVYIWRVVELAYFCEPSEEMARVKEVPWTMLAPAWVLAAATVYFGLHTELTVEVAQAAARELLGGGP